MSGFTGKDPWITKSKIAEIFLEKILGVIVLLIVSVMGYFWFFITGLNYSWGFKIFVTVTIILLGVGLSIVLISHGRKALLSKYLGIELKQLMDALSQGSTDLTFGDIFHTKNLFIPLNVTPLNNPSQFCSFDQILPLLEKGNSVLLLGDAGQGKTVVLKRLFEILAQKYINGEGDLLPIYIPLRQIELSIERSFNSEEFFQFLNGMKPRNPIPVSYPRFQNLAIKGKVVFLFDSFEEIPGDLSQGAIVNRANNPLFSYPSVLSCRNSFYEQYLSETAIKSHYLYNLKLCPIKFSDKSVQDYIKKFCEIKGYSQPNNIINVIRQNLDLCDLSRTPLHLMMILDIFIDLDPNMASQFGGNTWNLAQLYRIFIDNWLKKEASKEDSCLEWQTKDYLLKRIAWESYYAQEPLKASYGRYKYVQTRVNDKIILDVIDNVEKNRLPDKGIQDIKRDILFHTLLVIDRNGHYFFNHNNFRYFYIAKYIFENLKSDEEKAKQILEVSTPVETATFLRGMLKCPNISQEDADSITANLISVYEESEMDDVTHEIVREHSAYYLTCIGTESAITFVEDMYPHEPSSVVKRGILVGLATNAGKKEKLEHYIKIMSNDPYEQEINLSYNMAYYGDKPLIEIHECNDNYDFKHTLTAIFNHLNSESQKIHWVLDLFTLACIIRKRGTIISSINDENLQILERVLKQSYPELGEIFSEQQQELINILQQVEGFNLSTRNDLR